MSVAGIFASSLLNFISPNAQNRPQSPRAEFQQLGQDLQSGDLTAAQADFAGIQQQRTQTKSQSASPVAQDVDQLSQDLQAGNLTASQQDFAKIQQDAQQQQQTSQTHHHHHHGGGASNQSDISQLVSQLGQALQSGDLSSAQTAYSTLQQDLQKFLQTGPPSASGASGLTVNA